MKILSGCIVSTVFNRGMFLIQCCGSGSGCIRINLQMTSQNVWNMSLFEHFFKVLSLYLEARIRVRIRIKETGRSN
jgi:hypothetical protein